MRVCASGETGKGQISWEVSRGPWSFAPNLMGTYAGQGRPSRSLKSMKRLCHKLCGHYHLALRSSPTFFATSLTVLAKLTVFQLVGNRQWACYPRLRYLS